MEWTVKSKTFRSKLHSLNCIWLWSSLQSKMSNTHAQNVGELTLSFKYLHSLSSTLKSKDGLQVEGHYHMWFYSGVNHWLDIAWYKAEKRIKAAIQLDDFSPVHEGSKLTSSAVDSAHIFHQVIFHGVQLHLHIVSQQIKANLICSILFNYNIFRFWSHGLNWLGPMRAARPHLLLKSSTYNRIIPIFFFRTCHIDLRFCRICATAWWTTLK